MKNITATATGLLLALTLAACGIPVDPSTNGALPQAETTSAPATSAPATKAPTTKATKPKPVKPAAPKVSSCDAAREAILTGSPADITKALTRLQKDRTADATAREYARYYLGRDKNDKDMREMDIGLIQMSCSL